MPRQSNFSPAAALMRHVAANSLFSEVKLNTGIWAWIFGQSREMMLAWHG
jgi:hypothetical protein